MTGHVPLIETSEGVPGDSGPQHQQQQPAGVAATSTTAGSSSSSSSSAPRSTNPVDAVFQASQYTKEDAMLVFSAIIVALHLVSLYYTTKQ